MVVPMDRAISTNQGIQLHKEVVAVLNGYLPRQIVTRMDNCDLYLAEEWQTKEQVILKVGSRQERLIRGEVYYWPLINVAHAIEMSDYFCYGDYIYFVCPYFSNGSVHDVIAKSNALAEDGNIIKINELLVRKWAKQILIFLNRMHTMGLYHLNIRRKSLLVTQEVNVKVGGLGMMTMFNDRFALCGRMDHVAPEILETYPRARGCDLSKVDMWAVGGLLCELLTGIIISGCPTEEVLADRLNRRLLIRHKIDELPSHPQMSNISRGAKGFLVWLLKMEPGARPSARQALKHPWLRDQEIRLELHQLDKVLSKVTGRTVKLVTQMSVILPLVALVPSYGVATVRLQLKGRTELPQRHFRLGLAEEKVCYSKHAWKFRDHVLKVDKARLEMWTALYDILTQEGTRWHWQPCSQDIGRRFNLPTKRVYPHDDDIDPPITTRPSTPIALPTGSDESTESRTFNALGGGSDRIQTCYLSFIIGGIPGPSNTNIVKNPSRHEERKHRDRKLCDKQRHHHHHHHNHHHHHHQRSTADSGTTQDKRNRSSSSGPTQPWYKRWCLL